MDAAHSRQKNNRLRQERIARNWRQSDLAEQLGTSVITVRRWERGSQSPRAYFLVKLCALFGKSAEELGLTPEEEPVQIQQEGEEHIPPSNLEPSVGIWGISYARNPFFTGRQQILQTLHERLGQEHRMALTQSFAISGLGGIGKTQIALEYAYHYRQDYTAVFWVSAATRETLLTGLLSVAELLHLPEKDEHDQNKVMLAVKTWLASHQGWLFVVDNADDVALVQDIVQNVLLTQPGGHMLLTSRAQALGSLAQQIQVETMGMVEGILFLLRRAKLLSPDLSLEQISEEQLAAAEAIVITMDALPLALDQAGAYIEEVGCSLNTYLQIYHTHRAQLLQRRGHVPADHPESVATTWSLNFQRVEQSNATAAELLRLCAFLDPDMIPEEFLSEGSTAFSPLLQRVTTDVFALNKAIEELRKFSLVQRDPEAKVLRLHRLVQYVLQDAMNEADRLQWAQRVVRATYLVFPQTIDTTTLLRCRRFLSQAQICSGLIRDYMLKSTEAATLLVRTAHFLQDYALYEQVERLYQQAIDIQEQLLGGEHPEVARSLNGLARLFREQSKYGQAEQLYQSALSIWEQSSDTDDLEMAHTLNGLAYLYAAQGKYEQAEPLHIRSLSLAEQASEKDDLLIAEIHYWLAALYASQGKYIEAEPSFLQAFRIRERVLGLKHPLIVETLGGRARVAFLQEKYAEATVLYQQALQIGEQILDSRHTKLAAILTNLAELYQSQDQYEQAQPLFQRALSIWELAFGLEHPYLIYPLHGLAYLSHKQGKDEQAEMLYRRALRIGEQALGLEHPNVADSLHGLATLSTKLGANQQAELLYRRTLSIREKVLGEQHLDTAEIQHDFAVFWTKQKQYQEAIVFYQRALTTRTQILGTHHPKTTETRDGLYYVLHAPEKEEEAIFSSNISSKELKEES